jgi:ATP/maltotriose-dependent transcriptional regulator MalT
VHHGLSHYASDQLARNWLSLYSEGRGYTILGWLDRLPADVVASNPGLCLLASGLTRSLGRHEDAARWLAVVEADVPIEGEIAGFGCSTAATVAITRSMLQLASGDMPALSPTPAGQRRSKRTSAGSAKS